MQNLPIIIPYLRNTVIPFLDLKAINSRHKAEVQEAISGVIDSGWYILGEAVKQLEEAMEKYKKFLV